MVHIIFTANFYKASWQVIMAALEAFHRGNGSGFSSLNNGLIVLLPKRVDA